MIGETRAALPIGATIPGGKNGSMKTGATELGKHGANCRIGESAGISQRDERLIIRLSVAMWNVARVRQGHRSPAAAVQIIVQQGKQRLLTDIKKRATDMKMSPATIDQERWRGGLKIAAMAPFGDDVSERWNFRLSHLADMD